MLDRSIPFYNVILRCDEYPWENVVLPRGFAIAAYEKGYEKAWAELEYGIGDFDSADEAERYFVESYLQAAGKRDGILFLLNEEKTVIGSCIAWQDKRGDELVSSLHWLVVDEKYRGMGLGRALCHATMQIFREREGLPVYIHTQPWSWKAIFLYLSLGFRLQKSDTFSHYENQYDAAMATLKNVVTEKQFLRLMESSRD